MEKRAQKLAKGTRKNLHEGILWRKTPSESPHMTMRHSTREREREEGEREICMVDIHMSSEAVDNPRINYTSKFQVLPTNWLGDIMASARGH